MSSPHQPSVGTPARTRIAGRHRYRERPATDMMMVMMTSLTAMYLGLLAIGLFWSAWSLFRRCGPSADAITHRRNTVACNDGRRCDLQRLDGCCRCLCLDCAIVPSDDSPGLGGIRRIKLLEWRVSLIDYAGNFSKSSRTPFPDVAFRHLQDQAGV